MLVRATSSHQWRLRKKYDGYFLVIENNNGKSNTSFDWHLVIKQQGIDIDKKMEQKKKIEYIKPVAIKKTNLSKEKK